MSEAIADRMAELGNRAHAGEKISSEQMYDEINAIAEQYGSEYGIPIPVRGKYSAYHFNRCLDVPLGHNRLIGN